ATPSSAGLAPAPEPSTESSTTSSTEPVGQALNRPRLPLLKSSSERLKWTALPRSRGSTRRSRGRGAATRGPHEACFVGWDVGGVPGEAGGGAPRRRGRPGGA